MGTLERVTVVCFAASYAVALGIETWNLLRPRMILRWLAAGTVAAGIVAHVAYLIVQPLPVASSSGSLLLLAGVLAVFSCYGAVHHPRVAWGLFVLPLVLGLIALAFLRGGDATAGGTVWEWFQGPKFWGMTHGILVLLAAVGVCVGFLASVMYLVQLYRLRQKSAPLGGMKLLSLERLETMNRRAILWAFPLLTVGLLVGIGIQVRQGDLLEGWTSPKILSSLGLWLVFAILLYLRYAAHVRGRQVALWTVMAFVVMLAAILSPVHPFVGGGAP